MPTAKPDALTIASHIIMLKCPNCGGQKLYRRYLKQVDACVHCQTPWGNYQADDGPAWLTILILGHILIPLSVAFAMETNIESWQIISGVGVLSLLLVLLLLPFTKALFLVILSRRS